MGSSQRGFLAWLPGWQQALAWLAVVTLAMDELSHYLEGESAPTASVTARLEMWRGAWQLIQQRPLLGHGSEGYRQGMAELVEGAVVAPSVLPHGHAHNDLLDAWAKFGLPGLMALLALYRAWLVVLWTLYRHAPLVPEVYQASQCQGSVMPSG